METVYHFVLNPAAGKCNAQDLIPSIEACMKGRDIPYVIYVTKAPGDCEHYIRRISEEGKPVRFYVYGGDGTLNESINGAANMPNASVGVIPGGSGNDFVRSFANKEFFSDLNAQIDGEEIGFDLLRVNDRYSVNVTNIGFDCDVVVELMKLKKFPIMRGPFGYLCGVFVTLCRKMGQKMTATLADGSTFTDSYLLCSFGNGRYYGGGFCAAPRSCADDGLLEFTLVKKLRRLRFLTVLPCYKKGMHLDKPSLRKYITYARTPSVKLHSDKPFGLSRDGEVTFHTDVEVEAVKNAIRIVLPKGAAPLEGLIQNV